MKILIYFPVKKKYLKFWEYYNVDFNVITKISKDIYYADNFFSFLFLVFKSDFVYTWWWHRSLLVVLISKLFRKKILCTGAIHMFDLSAETTFYKRNFFYRIFNKISLYLCDANIFISNDQKNQITSHIKTNNPLTIYSSLNKNHLDLYQELQNTGFKEKTVNLTLMSTLWLTRSNIKRKGLFETLDALELIYDKDFLFYICGKKGDGLKSLMDKVNLLKIRNKVKIITDITEDDKYKLLRSTQLYLQPSYCEGLGNAVIEAMAFGCIPLVSRYTAQPEIVSNFGFIINEINPVQISEKILTYMNYSEKKKVECYISVLDYTHKQFSFNKHVIELKNVFNKLEKT